MPKNFAIWGPGVVRFADTCRRLSGGRLDITVKGAGEVVPSMQIFDAVRDGDVEMGHSAAYFWDGKDSTRLRASVYYTSVPFGMTGAGTYSWLQEGGGQALWEELYAPFNLQPIALGNTGVQAGGWFRKPIRTLEDLQGLTMRIPGLGGKVLEAAGGRPQTIPGQEIYIALERGRIDATEWIGPSHDMQRGFQKVAKYYYTGGWHEPGSILELIINKQKWNELDAGLQEIVRLSALEADRWMYRSWIAADGIAYQELLADDSLTVEPFPVEVAKALRPFADQLKQEIAESSPLAKRITDSYASFQQRYMRYYRDSEGAYLGALDDRA